MFVRASKYRELLLQKNELVRACMGWVPDGTHKNQLLYCKEFGELSKKNSEIAKAVNDLDKIKQLIATLENSLEERVLQIHQAVEATTSQGYFVYAQQLIEELNEKGKK